MSFWPFGQAINNSNINAILEEYLSVLRATENEEHSKNSRSEEGPESPRDISNPSVPQDIHITKTTSFQSVDAADSLLPYEENDSREKLDNRFVDRLLDESELLNELSRQNNSLLDFICLGYFYEATEGQKDRKIQNLEYLIDTLLECVNSIDAAQFTENTTQNNLGFSSGPLRKATIISEIFSLDIWVITESLVKCPQYLAKIWRILDHDLFKNEKLPLISIFLKINSNLLVSRQDQYLNFIRSRGNLVDEMLQHIEITTLMDFFLKCISSDKLESPTGIIQLVYDQNLIPKCLAFFDNNKYAHDIQSCCGDFLKALIAISANAPLDDMSIGPNILTRQLCSYESINRFIDIIINEKGFALNVVVSIVIELIRKNNSDYDQVNLLETTITENPPSDRDPIYLGYLLKNFAQRLPDIFDANMGDAQAYGANEPMVNQINETFVPIGFQRFKIVELAAELLHCSNMGLMNSRKVEKIVAERDAFRRRVAKNLQDALQDLTIDQSKNINNVDNIPFNDRNNDNTRVDNNDETLDFSNDNTNDNDSNNKMHENFTGITHESTDKNASKDDDNDDGDDDDYDDSFEIPYVNEIQNAKLRTSPSIGDCFKISLYDSLILPRIISIFLTHPWNNFWHNVIYDIIQQIFNGRMDFSYNSFLVYSLFNLQGSFKFMPKDRMPESLDIANFNITNNFILKGYEVSFEFYDKWHMNLGFMGHLVLIAEEIVKFSKLYKVEFISPDIFEILQEKKWQFYAEEILNDTRIMYSKILGGGNYVDDGNGNIIPQLPEPTVNMGSSNEGEDGMPGGKEDRDVEDELRSFAEADLHEKQKPLFIDEHPVETNSSDVNPANGSV